MGSKAMVGAFAMASALLVAAVSLQSAGAEEGATQPWVDQINSITAAARSDMDAVVAPVAAALETATTDGEARAIRDAARDAVKDIYELARDDIDAVVDDSDDDPDVKVAAGTAEDAVGDAKSVAVDEINALYDEWKFRYDAPPAEEVIAKLDENLAEGLGKIAADLDRYAHDLEGADDVDKADGERGKAFERLVDEVAAALADLDKELSDRPFDPLVQDAYAEDVSQLLDVETDAEIVIVAMHDDWVAEHFPIASTTTTTTTTRPSPATTRPTKPTKPTTTTTLATRTETSITTGAATTTTTLGPSAQLPPTEPPLTDMVYMADPPETQVLAENMAVSSTEMAGSDMATTSFVRRIVDTQLPAGVSSVAVGPLVVLGLVLDAVLAAGALMAVPWLLLGIYMVGLIRGTITLEPKPEG